LHSSGIKTKLQQEMTKRKLEKFATADVTNYLDDIADADGDDPFSVKTIRKEDSTEVKLQEDNANIFFVESYAKERKPYN
jgi:hypothetical protein